MITNVNTLFLVIKACEYITQNTGGGDCYFELFHCFICIILIFK